MFVSVTSNTVYHSKLLSLLFCFVLELSIWHRIGWVHHRFFCCSIFRCLCSALKIIVCFISLCHWIVCTRFVLPRSISRLASLSFCTLLCLSWDWWLLFTFDIFWLLLRYCLISPFVPLCFLFLITPLLFLDHSVDIFRSLRWYLQITPLVYSDHPTGIF